MTTPANASDSTDEGQTDSTNLDLIAAYVRDQRKEAKSWSSQLGGITVYIGLAAFFFGIGSLSDLRHRLSPSPTSIAQQAREDFVRSLDESCRTYISVPATTTKGGLYARIVVDDENLLKARRKMYPAWYRPIPGNLSIKDTRSLESIRSYYFAADNLLQAAIGRANASDADGYLLDIGLYRQANADFVAAAGNYGFTVCSHYWAAT